MVQRINAAVFGTVVGGQSEYRKRIKEMLPGLINDNKVELVLFPGWEIIKFMEVDSLAGLSAGDQLLEEAFQEELLSFYQELARCLQAFVGVNLPIREGENCFNRAYLLDIDGAILGSQDQIHLQPWAKSAGLAEGKEVKVMDTPFGRLGFILGADNFYPEVGRILALKGAELILAPTIYLPPYNPWDQLAGIWQVVQQNQFFALENPANLILRNAQVQGMPAIYGPCDITPEETGFLAGPDNLGISGPNRYLNQAEDFTSKLLAEKGSYFFHAELNFADLERARAQFPIRDLFNRELYREKLVYDSPAGGEKS
ncbi:MAG: nitrilase-related carbon-nitrogen hydrolase [Halanaerobium sp.]|nr:nitrilase-related carbon-nitrogen hydrolase [Halanaerobium sp.]